MKYAVIQNTDGNFNIVSEWGDLDGAIKAWHNQCVSLMNDTSFREGFVAVIDSQLNLVNGYYQRIEHAATEVTTKKSTKKAE